MASIFHLNVMQVLEIRLKSWKCYGHEGEFLHFECISETNITFHHIMGRLRIQASIYEIYL